MHAHRLPSCQMTTTTRSSPVDAPRPRSLALSRRAPAARGRGFDPRRPRTWRYPSTSRPTFATSCPTRRSGDPRGFSPTICPTSSTPSRRRSAIWRAPCGRDSLDLPSLRASSLTRCRVASAAGCRLPRLRRARPRGPDPLLPAACPSATSRAAGLDDGPDAARVSRAMHVFERRCLESETRAAA